MLVQPRRSLCGGGADVADGFVGSQPEGRGFAQKRRGGRRGSGGRLIFDLAQGYGRTMG